MNRNLITRLTAALAAASALGLVATPSFGESKPKLLIKVATLAPDGSTWMTVMHDMDAEIRSATGNAVGFKFYPNMVQGDELVVLRRIRNGQLHGGGFTGVGLGEIAPATRVLELPFLIQSYEDVDRVHQAIDGELERMMVENSFVLLGWAEVGPVYLFTNEPVRSQEDMASVKMWLWEGDPIAEAMFRIFKIPPIPLSIAHVMTALQTGMIDGVYASPYACIALQWFTRVKYMSNVPVSHATGALVIDKKIFEKIPSEHRTAVRTIARRRLDGLVQSTRRENAEALDAIIANGIEIVTPDSAQLASLREHARLVWDDQVDDLYPRRLLDRVLETLASGHADAAKSE